MKVLCISASNTKLMGSNSTSVKVCKMIGDIIKKEYETDAIVDLAALVRFELKPCILCGQCCETSSCIYDDSFNSIFSKLSEADAIFFVVPHYSPIPSKLLILFEKINEIAYAGWLSNPDYALPFSGKPVGIIGHGGMTEKDETLKYYHDSLITTVANTLKSLSFQIVGYSEDYPNGAPFGLKDDDCLKKSENNIFPDIIQDYELIENRIRPLINNVMNSLNK